MASSFATKALLAFLSASTVSAFGVGSQQTETHPKLQWKRCTGKGGTSCSTVNGEIVVDSNWRWLHTTSGTTNCYTGNKWDSSLCADNDSCSKNCVMDGADYSGTYGITTGTDSLTLKFVTKGQYSTNIGSRSEYRDLTSNNRAKGASSLSSSGYEQLRDVQVAWKRVYF